MRTVPRQSVKQTHGGGAAFIDRHGLVRAATAIDSGGFERDE